jgi:hypothetical protein
MTKNPDGVPGQLACLAMIPAVEMRLPTAGLVFEKVDIHSQAPEQSYRRHAHVGKQRVAQAGHHQRDFQPVFLSSKCVG